MLAAAKRKYDMVRERVRAVMLFAEPNPESLRDEVLSALADVSGGADHDFG